MSLQFKLVGIEDYNKKVLIYKVKKDEKGELSFTVNDIFNFIISLVGNKIDDALKLEKIKKEFKDNFSELKLIYSSKAINADEKYNVEDDKVESVYIFTQNIEIRNKYKEIFNEYGTLLESIKEFKKVKEVKESKLDKKYNEKLVDESCEDDVLTEEQIANSNLDIIELFKNKRFLSLFEIYKEEPELFDYFSSYVSCGNIINDEDEVNEDDDSKLDTKQDTGSNDNIEHKDFKLEEEEEEKDLKSDISEEVSNLEKEFEYTDSLNSLIKILKDINIEYDIEKLKQLLITNSGFINLPLRQIVYNSCNSD